MEEPEVKYEVDCEETDFFPDSVKIELEDTCDFNGSEDAFEINEDFRDPLQDPLDVEQERGHFGSSDYSDAGSEERELTPTVEGNLENSYSEPRKGIGLTHYKILMLDRLPHKCEMCSQSFYDYLRFRDHMKDQHNTDPVIYCDICNIPCATKQAYSLHLSRHPKSIRESAKFKKKEKGTYARKCSICDFVAKGQRKLQYHMETEHGNVLDENLEAKYRNNPAYKYECEYCKVKYKSKVVLIAHLTKRHYYKRPTKSKDYYHCFECQEPFTTIKGRRNHMKKCHLNKPKPVQNKKPLENTKDNESTNNPQEGIQEFSELKWYECPAPSCKNRYTTADQMERHKVKCLYLITPIKDTTCEDCGKTFKYGLRMHLKTQCRPIKDQNTDGQNILNESGIAENNSKVPKTRKLDRPYKCPEEGCNTSFVSEFVMSIHRSKVHGYQMPITNPKRQCKICGARFRYLAAFKLRRHMHVVHGVPWKLINKQQTSETQQSEVADKFGDDDFWNQELIPEVPPTTKDIERKNTKKEVQIVKCPWCDLTFKSQKEFFQHEHVHGDSRQVACEHCGKVLCSAKSKIRHTAKCGDETHLCNICGMIFRHEVILKRHEKTHSTDRPFVCELCGLSFKTINHLRNHTKNHEEEVLDKNLFKCNECGKVLKHSNSLKKHMSRSHIGPLATRIISCQICGKTTKNMTNMRIHMQIHDPNRVLKTSKKESAK